MTEHPPSTAGLLAELRGLEPVDMAFAATVDGRDGSFVLDRFDGERTGSLRGVHSMAGQGLGGRCIALRSTVYVTDYVRARGISHQYDRAVDDEGLRSIVAVPVLAGTDVRGVVYTATRGRLGFGERFVDRVVSLVHHRPAGTAGTEPGTEPDALDELRDITAAVDDPDLHRRLRAVLDRLDPRSARRPLSPLTPRERDVLAEVALGHGNRAVAARLGLREQTVKSYLKAAMSKLDSHTRGEAVHRGRACGLVP